MPMLINFNWAQINLSFFFQQKEILCFSSLNISCRTSVEIILCMHFFFLCVQRIYDRKKVPQIVMQRKLFFTLSWAQSSSPESCNNSNTKVAAHISEATCLFLLPKAFSPITAPLKKNGYNWLFQVCSPNSRTESCTTAGARWLFMCLERRPSRSHPRWCF